MLSRRLLEAGLLPLICRQTDTLIFVTVDSQSSSSSDVTLPAVVLQTYSTPTEDIVLTTLDHGECQSVWLLKGGISG
ncbi:hypothetical protein F5141DRAFT_1148024 [Pisolithus sp. B1]|nr:hypothetical protein F5141DRAFT_1148024 [Pisolithus sp. B1]